MGVLALPVRPVLNGAGAVSAGPSEGRLGPGMGCIGTERDEEGRN